ncbi:MAG: hypothetical protein OXD49_09465 [Candidatus Poribacteria bacterium]|nr:hypothetical protein [Candidatus Poribacteria bacterium]
MRAIDAFKMDKATFSVLSSFEETDESVNTLYNPNCHLFIGIASVLLPSNEQGTPEKSC